MKSTHTWKSIVGMGLGVALAGCGPEMDMGAAREADAEPGTTSQRLTNIVTNGSFEQSPIGYSNWVSLFAGDTRLTGWTILGAGVDVMASSYKPAANGTTSLDLNAYEAGGISQTLTTVPGTGYTVQFALSTSPGCVGYPGYTRTVKVSAGSIVYNFSSSSGGWSSRSFVFNATGTSTVLKFESLSGGVSCGPAIDNVAVMGP